MFVKHLRLSSLLGILLLGTAAQAQTRYADANLVTGANNGSSWADAHRGSGGLQVALAASTPGSRIFVAEGTYLPTATGSRSTSFNLRNNVEVYGSFLGTEAEPNERPAFGTAPSILSADLAGNDGASMTGENSFHVVNGSGTNASALLDGFTIQGGNADSGGNNNRGAGLICISNSSPTLRNCNFVSNRTTFGGGAVYVNASAPRFFDCRFEDNIGGSFGGAFDIATAGAVRFERCFFTGNRAGRAGAVEIFSTTGVTLINCVFTDNRATGSGGGGAMWMGSGGTTTIRNCSFVANHSNTNQVGGVRLQGANATLVNCILWNNNGPGGAMDTNNQTNMLVGGVTYSIVQGGLVDTGNLDVDPQFTDQGAEDFSLTSGSPAIDAGRNADVPAGVTVDHIGNPRFVDDPSVADTGSGSAPLVDIGAFEFPGGPLGTSYCLGDGTGNACPCGNTGGAGEGCATSTGSGMTLSLSGTTSIAADDLTLIVDGVPINNTGIFYAGQTLFTGNTLFDGLQCIGGSTLRFQGQLATSSMVSDTNLVSQDLFGLFWTPGTTYGFQYFTRDNQTGASPCSGFANLSQGMSVVMTP